jgi:hypothetical protein
MKPKHLFWGFLFITIGLLVLLNNFESIDLDWITIWKFWPAALILLGISFLTKQEVMKGFLVSLTAIMLAFAVFATFKAGWELASDNLFIDFDDGIEISEWDSEDIEITKFVEELKPGIKKAILNFNAGAGSFKLKDTTSKLIFVTAQGVRDNYRLSRSDGKETSTIDFDMERARFSFKKGKIKNRVEVNLNPEPVWKINMDLGGAAIDFDFSKFKVEKIDMHMGAASLKAKLGSLSDELRVTLDAGASSIEIWVPETSGCEIRTDATLSSKSFEDFRKIRSDYYRTENFESAEKKIYLELDSGVSSLRVKRYSESWE